MKTFALALFLAGLVATQAACPNQCSGHGKCSENDTCECFKQTGTTWRQRVGWTGPDCSMRTCPLGVAYDTLSTTRGVDITPVKFTAGRDFSGSKNTAGQGANGNLIAAFAKGYALGETKTFSVRISDVTDAAAGAGTGGSSISYQWKLDTHAAYSSPASLHDATAVTQCTYMAPCELVNNGEGTASTGIYIYVPSAVAVADLYSNAGAQTGAQEGNSWSFTYNYQEGRPYEYGQSNNAHQHVMCSGRGSCDSASGRCTCFSGFSGEACQRTTCPNDCSGHGVCQDLRRFASDAGKTYSSAYDARKEMGCSCDDGFRGADCSQVECPSGADPMGHFGGDGQDSDDAAGEAMDCSGRGLCDYSSGTCNCFKGYYGERCEQQTNFV